MQQSPIGWVGGKRRLRAQILRLFPQHDIYVEVFAGAAWVLFGKEPTGTEILNDLNGELTNFYRCVRQRPMELVDALKFRLISQEDFLAERALTNDGGSEIERASRFFWILKTAFGAKARADAPFGYRLAGGAPRFRADLIGDIIQRAHDRLKHVQIFSEDCERLIRRLDRPTTFFYCDPPYYGVSGCYRHEFTEADHERLAATLKRISGKFLLSYNDCERVRELYSWANVDSVTTSYSITRKVSARSKPVNELFIRNYELAS